MKLASRFLIPAIILLSVSCNSPSSISTITPALPTSTPPMPATSDLGITALPSKFAPTTTPDISSTALIQTTTAGQSAEQTLVAPFPNICNETLYPWELSPNGLWMTRLCESPQDQSLIFTVTNRESKTLWKLAYKDYTQRPGILFDEGFEVVNWSNDNRYAYISLLSSGDGGDCFAGVHEKENGKALLRLDLQTGRTTTILPLRADFGGYGFSFAPTGRRFVYEKFSQGMKILDLQSGQLVDVIPTAPFDVGGAYLWSPDGLHFVYSTSLSTNEESTVDYSIRLVNGKDGSEAILIQSAQNCFAAKKWEDNNILVMDRFDQDYNVTVVRYDTEKKQILSEATATPFP